MNRRIPSGTSSNICKGDGCAIGNLDYGWGLTSVPHRAHRKTYMTESQEPALPAHAFERIDAFLQPRGGLGAVRQLPLNRLVVDCNDKFIAFDKTGEPAAFIAVADASYPASVSDAATTTLAIRDALGEDLGKSVLAPAFVGDIHGRSYSITAYCQPMSNGRWRGHWQRVRLRPAMLSWLGSVTRQTARAMPDKDQAIRSALEALSRHAAVDESVRKATRAALNDLEGGRWKPRRVVAHNDLWWGNFVRHRDRADGELPFYVIDWAGGRIDGVPIYDLVRLAMSLRLNARSFLDVLRAHCAYLKCESSQAPHYLCAAFGELSLNLGEWPEAQFALTARACLQYAAQALA